MFLLTQNLTLHFDLLSGKLGGSDKAQDLEQELWVLWAGVISSLEN